MIIDDGTNNTITNNWYYQHNAEVPYPIWGLAENSDSNPSEHPKHFGLPDLSTSISPGQILPDTVEITWDQVSDEFGHVISYNLYYTLTGGENNEWYLLTSSEDTNFNWNTTAVSGYHDQVYFRLDITDEHDFIAYYILGSFIIDNEEISSNQDNSDLQINLPSTPVFVVLIQVVMLVLLRRHLGMKRLNS